MKDFLYKKSWFEKEYKDKLGLRWETMKIALNLFNQVKGKTIVETGTTRQVDDWGAGMSTLVFSSYLKRYGGTLTTIDIDPKAIETCRAITEAYKDNITYVVDDSLSFLEKFKGKIDLLYLDSYDYPYGEMLDFYGGKSDVETAENILQAMEEGEVVSTFKELIYPSQNHQLKELKAALPSMAEMGIILLDDSGLPGGGKTRTTKEFLEKQGATCIFDAYQSLWML